MSSAEISTPDPPGRCRRYRWLQVVLMGGALIAYVTAEWSLRQCVYGRPKIKTTADWKPIVDKLPTLLREPLARRLKAAELEDKIAVEKVPKKKLKLYYDLAPLVSGSRQEEVFKKIVTQFPKNPAAHRAWVALIRNFNLSDPVSKYLNYARNCEYKNNGQKAIVWTAGWGVIHGRSEADQEQFLKAMVEEKVVGAGLVDAYETLVGVAIRDSKDHLYARADSLLQVCKKLWAQEQERRMK